MYVYERVFKSTPGPMSNCWFCCHANSPPHPFNCFWHPPQNFVVISFISFLLISFRLGYFGCCLYIKHSLYQNIHNLGFEHISFFLLSSDLLVQLCISTSNWNRLFTLWYKYVWMRVACGIWCMCVSVSVNDCL